MRIYRTGFWLAVILNLVLAVILSRIWWRDRTPGPAMSREQTAMAPPTPQGSIETSVAAAPATDGVPMTPVRISAQRLQSIGVKTGTVKRRRVDDDIRTTGNVVVDESRLAYVQVRFSGYVEKVFADATYEYVRKGQPLVTIYAPDVVATEREYLVAKQNQEQVGQSAVPGVAASASALLDAAAERLKQWGVPQTEITRLAASGQVQQELEIDSPISGFITERNALPSVAVRPEMRLYTIADLSTVWVQAQAFQTDLERIHVGAPATLTTDAFQDRTFRGHVDFIYPQVDMDTRTAKVRVVFSNPGLQLKPGMFVNVDLKVPMGQQLVIPATGVLQSGTHEIAFVDRGDGYIEPREVEVGARVGEDVIVLKGLKSGEQVVTSANFLIDSESQLQAALGAFAPAPPGPEQITATQASQASVEFSSDATPPRKGTNVFRVKLVDAGGLPMSGADVKVAFFMPAMPEMGMAPMQTSVALKDQGRGFYEGSGNLESGGTWQVTVIAKKNGRTVASKEFSINASGGR